MLEGVELASSANARLHFVADQQRAGFVDDRLHLQPAFGVKLVDALTLNGFDDECGDVAPKKFPAQGRYVAKRNFCGPGQERTEAALKFGRSI